MAIKIKNENQPNLTLVEKKTFNNQANLIALNAWFEAARNGKSGIELAISAEKMKNHFNYSKYR
jgi:hypothetical protein